VSRARHGGGLRCARLPGLCSLRDSPPPVATPRPLPGSSDLRKDEPRELDEVLGRFASGIVPAMNWLGVALGRSCYAVRSRLDTAFDPSAKDCIGFLFNLPTLFLNGQQASNCTIA
jgi:hypothetical protein